MNTTHMTPSIVLTNRDNDRLSALAESQHGVFATAGHILAQEIEQASIVEPANVPPNVVTMNTRVMVRDEETGKTRVFTLVYPNNENSPVGKLSILTPAGAALIGLTEGETFTWITRDGRTKEMTVVDILYQPEANGRFDL